jgi:hypothetical protein
MNARTRRDRLRRCATARETSSGFVGLHAVDLQRTWQLKPRVAVAVRILPSIPRLNIKVLVWVERAEAGGGSFATPWRKAVALRCLRVERAMGIEPTAQAWEAWVLPLYDARPEADSSRIAECEANGNANRGGGRLLPLWI